MEQTEEDRQGRVTILTDVDLSPLNVEVKVFKNVARSKATLPELNSSPKSRKLPMDASEEQKIDWFWTDR